MKSLETPVFTLEARNGTFRTFILCVARVFTFRGAGSPLQLQAPHGERPVGILALREITFFSALGQYENLSQEFLQFVDIAARYGNGIVAVAHYELHGTGIGGDMFHLSEIDHKGTMTTDYHRISL